MGRKYFQQLFLMFFLILGTSISGAYLYTTLQLKNVEAYKQKTTNSVKLQPNEMGQIMVVMYHGLSEKSSKNEYTRSVEAFREDLDTFRTKGYYPIPLKDFVFKNINVPIGKTPILLTFDDASKTQGSFIKQKGELIPVKDTAVELLNRYHTAYPEFPVHATFFVNANPFPGEGTVSERLKWMMVRGYDIGNHTYSHINLSKSSEAQIQKEMALVVDMVHKSDANYAIIALGRPFGSCSKKFYSAMFSGKYQGITYKNLTSFLVGANPSPSVYSKHFNILSVPRIRAGNGVGDYDLDFWISYFDKHPTERYVSDGNPNTVVVPLQYKKLLNKKFLGQAMPVYTK